MTRPYSTFLIICIYLCFFWPELIFEGPFCHPLPYFCVELDMTNVMLVAYVRRDHRQHHDIYEWSIVQDYDFLMERALFTPWMTSPHPQA